MCSNIFKETRSLIVIVKSNERERDIVNETQTR